MDVLAVESAVRERPSRAPRARAAFPRARTYRFRAHSMYDPDCIAAKTKSRNGSNAVPIETFAAICEQKACSRTPSGREMEASVAAEIAEAVAVAEAGPWEPVEDLTRDVYTPTLMP